MPITANMIDPGLARQQAAARKAAAGPAPVAPDAVEPATSAPAPTPLPQVEFVDASALAPATFDRGYLTAGHAAESPANKGRELTDDEKDALAPEAREIQDRLDEAEERIDALPDDANPWTDAEAADAYADELEARADAEDHPEHPEGMGAPRTVASRRTQAHHMRRSGHQYVPGGMGAIDTSRG